MGFLSALTGRKSETAETEVPLSPAKQALLAILRETVLSMPQYAYLANGVEGQMKNWLRNSSDAEIVLILTNARNRIDSVLAVAYGTDENKHYADTPTETGYPRTDSRENAVG